MITADYHIHTKYSDGKHSLEEIVQKAIDMGMKKLGFSDHSFLEFDQRFCISYDNIPVYKDEVKALREKYKEKIELYCGIEQDTYCTLAPEGYDYIIGSVHFIKVGEELLPVDETPEQFIADVNKHFDGDFYSYIEQYYNDVANVIDVTGADIIGHFDLVTKFNEKLNLFDESHPRYIAAFKAAADKLIKTGKLFEINTGAISRGYRTKPYPSTMIMDYLHEHGAKFIFSSDSHSANSICCEFENISNSFKEKYVIVDEIKKTD